MESSEPAWSVSETDVMRAVAEIVRDGREAVLATVVDVEGNAYRRPGAKMLVTPDGSGVGSITAGCLEDEVVELARRVLEDGESRIETYDLMEDDDVWGLGVGCNGIIDVLLEPLDDGFRPVVDAFEDGDDVASLTVLESDHDDVSRFDRGYYDPTDGVVSTDDGFEWLEKSDVDVVDELVERGRGGTIPVSADDRSIELFVDGIAAPPELVVLGTGHDVAPIVELAAKNDFRVRVIGFRGADAVADRFPDAAAVSSTSPSTLREAHDFDENTYVVVMTHNFLDDRLAIDELLRTPVPYVGLMGPRERFEEMLEEFADEDRSFDDGELDRRVYTPVGLDLGGGSPYQIAHSIVAELLAVHNDRTPRHLSEREGPIHRRISSITDD
ncbi:XdhC family protein [Natrarchaeobius oligotrophus]|uniref:XdhC family protein n=1 Tax=Natrarchaeobius chitinivorans TaxID=1679083 RepID=A0A3N6PLU8_NATCH|nr:XdhC family protein [Natrarchaeobius chitinivorans]RQH02490.1 XdhC family protein [Natrarchaeobius chitinivorans]